MKGVTKELTSANIGKWTRGAEVVVDCFDNSASRASHPLVPRQGAVLPSSGRYADYGEVKWNERYQVPGDVAHVGTCAYPFARNSLLFIVAIGSESLLHFLWRSEKRDFSFTLEDFSINRENKN